MACAAATSPALKLANDLNRSIHCATAYFCKARLVAAPSVTALGNNLELPSIAVHLPWFALKREAHHILGSPWTSGKNKLRRRRARGRQEMRWDLLLSLFVG